MRTRIVISALAAWAAFALVFTGCQAKLLDTLVLLDAEQQHGLRSEHLTTTYRVLRAPAIEWNNWMTQLFYPLPPHSVAENALARTHRLGPIALYVPELVSTPFALFRMLCGLGAFFVMAWTLRSPRLHSVGGRFLNIELLAPSAWRSSVRRFEWWASVTYILASLLLAPLVWLLFFDRSPRGSSEPYLILPAAGVSLVAASAAAYLGHWVAKLALARHLAHHARALLIENAVCCPHCGHGVHGLAPGTPCPECGPAVEAEMCVPANAIAGIRRRSRGLFLMCVVMTQLGATLYSMWVFRLSPNERPWSTVEEWLEPPLALFQDYQETRWPPGPGVTHIQWKDVEALIAYQQIDGSAERPGAVVCAYAWRARAGFANDATRWEFHAKSNQSSTSPPTASVFLNFGASASVTALLGTIDTSRGVATIGGRATSAGTVQPGSELGPIADELQITLQRETEKYQELRK